MTDDKGLIAAGSIVGAILGGLPGAILGGVVGSILAEIRVCEFCGCNMQSSQSAYGQKSWYCPRCGNRK